MRMRPTPLILALVLFFALGCVLGCGDASVPLAQKLFMVDRSQAAEDMDEVAPQSLRRLRKRFGQASLYIDGKFMGMLRFSEVHPSVATQIVKLDIPDEDIYVRRFVWSELFAAHGVDLAHVQAVHFYGGRDRISVVDGDEFRRVAKTLQFSFTAGHTGNPRQRPPVDGMKMNSGIDIVRGVAVYAERPAPSYDKGTIVFPDGKRVSVRDERGKLTYPYAASELHGGTRVYFDGRYVDSFRRRALTPDLLRDPADPSSPYLLGKTLKKLGIDVKSITRIQVWGGGDELVADWQGAALDKLDDVTFALSQHSRGQVLLTRQPEKKLASFMIYSRLTVVDRALPAGTGSDAHHADREK
jgi:hypothetical protein